MDTRTADGRVGTILISLGTRLTVLAVTVAIGLLALEGATRWYFERYGLHYGVEMWKYARLVKRPSAVAAIGHEHAPNRQARLMGVDVRTNRWGLRDPDRALVPPAGTIRILVLGDSMTFGWGVPEPQTYPRVLERLLNQGKVPYEVINAGVGNYNTAQEVAWLRERGVQFEPRQVILGFYVNDAEPTPRPSDFWLARHSYLFVVASSAWDALQRRIGWTESYETYYARLYRGATPGWLACRQALEELFSLCRERGIGVHVVLLPELHRVNQTYPFRFVHRAVAEVATRHAVPVVDLADAFRGWDPRALWVSPGDAHANGTAHHIIAESVFRAVGTDAGQAVWRPSGKGGG